MEELSVYNWLNCQWHFDAQGNNLFESDSFQYMGLDQQNF